MADLRDLVAINIGRLRRENGWTQEDLAERAGLSARYVGQIERAQASMSISVLGRIADALAISPAALVTDFRQPGTQRASRPQR